MSSNTAKDYLSLIFILPCLIVIRSDTLCGISLQYGVNAADIKKANSLWSERDIHMKDTILVPVNAERVWERKPLTQLLEFMKQGYLLVVLSLSLPPSLTIYIYIYIYIVCA